MKDMEARFVDRELDAIERRVLREMAADAGLVEVDGPVRPGTQGWGLTMRAARPANPPRTLAQLVACGLFTTMIRQTKQE